MSTDRWLGVARAPHQRATPTPGPHPPAPVGSAGSSTGRPSTETEVLRAQRDSLVAVVARLTGTTEAAVRAQHGIGPSQPAQPQETVR